VVHFGCQSVASGTQSVASGPWNFSVQRDSVWHIACSNGLGMAKSVEELLVYQKSLAASAEISAIIRRDSFNRDPRLRDQLGSSSERVASLIAEGFEQSTDRHFAQYLYRSRGSGRETRTQLVVARDRRHITELERERISAMYEEVARMLTGLIDHLETEDRKHRR
jgi:four helix bundle protein